MKIKSSSRSSEFSVRRTDRAGEARGFSLVEVLVVMTILTLIVFALMSVFSSTQRAFRASVTQSDVLQGGRAAMDLIMSDLRTATPCNGFSLGNTNDLSGGYPVVGYGVNFFVTNNGAFYLPLLQSLPGSSNQRTNLLQWFFVLSRQNTKWTGVGYIVNTASTSYFYPLYRFYGETNISHDPSTLFNAFVLQVNQANGQGFTNMSHVIDGVVHLVVHGYDINGSLMTNGYSFTQMTNGTPRNTWFTPPYPSPVGEIGFVMSSNALPATVELQMGVMEDRAMQRSISLGIPGQPIISGALTQTSPAQWTYMQGLAGHVQIFRQRVTIQNADPSAYQ